MTNLEKIKEILNKYTEPQDMDYYLHGCIMNEQFDDLAKEVVKLFAIHNVSQQREQLCDCGKPVESEYAPCCSLSCWCEMFEGA